MKLRFYTDEKIVILEDSKNHEEINFSVDRRTSFFFTKKGSDKWNEIIIDFNDDKEVFVVGTEEYTDRQHLILCADHEFYRFFSIPYNDTYNMED